MPCVTPVIASNAQRGKEVDFATMTAVRGFAVPISARIEKKKTQFFDAMGVTGAFAESVGFKVQKNFVRPIIRKEFIVQNIKNIIWLM